MNFPRIYLSARQFPHLAGLTEAEVRDRVRSALLARPRLIAIKRLRTFFAALAMLAIVTALYDPARANLGQTLLIVGAAGFVFMLLWNLLWLNRVIYRITQPDWPER